MFTLGDIVMTRPDSYSNSYVGFVVSFEPAIEGTVTCRFWYTKEMLNTSEGMISGHGSMSVDKLIKIGSLSDFGVRVWELPYAEW